jgi:hypothetical protein
MRSTHLPYAARHCVSHQLRFSAASSVRLPIQILPEGNPPFVLAATLL